MGADADPVSTPAKKSAGIADLRRSFSAAVGSADSMHVVVGAVVIVVVVLVLDALAALTSLSLPVPLANTPAKNSAGTVDAGWVFAAGSVAAVPSAPSLPSVASVVAFVAVEAAVSGVVSVSVVSVVASVGCGACGACGTVSACKQQIDAGESQGQPGLYI